MPLRAWARVYHTSCELRVACGVGCHGRLVRPCPPTRTPPPATATIPRMARPESCIELAGASPAAVSAGAPRSRPRAREEIPPPEWGVKSPPRDMGPVGGEPVRRPSHKRTLQPREIRTRKGGPAEPLMSRQRQQTAPATGGVQDARGVWRRACGHRSMRNRRGPSRRLTFSDGGPYKPTAKGDRAGRASEGPVVPKGRRRLPVTPVPKAGRGKGPCFGHGGGWR